MEAFERAWSVLKTPFRGTSAKWYDKAVKEGVIPARQTEKNRKGVWAGSPSTAFNYSLGSSGDAPVVHYLPEHIEGVGDFDKYTDYGYYPFDVPTEQSQEVWRGVPYDEWHKEQMQAIFEAEAAGNHPTPKAPNRQRYYNAMRSSFDEAPQFPSDE